MGGAYELVAALTSSTNLSQGELRRTLRDFSDELGWRPGYHILEGPFVGPIANAHLVVEHGLEPSAVITFLNQSTQFSHLTARELNMLMGLSYNSLVDWHLYVERDRVTFCFNRAESPVIDRRDLSQFDDRVLRSEAFQQVTERRPTPNFPALDEALIRTLSNWKRVLSAELADRISNDHLSALFNGILLTRAIEDFRASTCSDALSLSRAWVDSSGSSLGDLLESTLRQLTGKDVPEWLLDKPKLVAFDGLGRDTVAALVRDFYLNRFAPYRYDFSIMSKHALSRVYEHYSTLLHIEESPQASFFPILPQEEINKSYGSIYTPQFIAGFFARFLRDQLIPPAFKTIKAVDPACGSGIFLRTLLELQCDPFQDGVTSEMVRQAFENALALDVDENACRASRLSLALLYLILIGNLPERLGVVCAESIQYYTENSKLREAFDAVIVNPPFVSIEMQSPQMRDRIASFMGKDAQGRIDMYLAFLRLGLEMIRPGGYGLFVLPHSFLFARHAEAMRERLTSETWIRCLADLSAIRVFGDMGTYVILLIFQKKSSQSEPAPAAAVIKCQDFVGHALEDYLQGQRIETNSYSIYEVDQQEFLQRDWVILPPLEMALKRKLRSLPSLKTYATVRQGLITGADDVFIVDKANVPDKGGDLFVHFLPDRLMERYHLPRRVPKRVFYPYYRGAKVSAAQLQHDFRGVWEYLCHHRKNLEARKSVRSKGRQWWEPIWPRPPEHLMRPKIVTPHLVMVPRFCLDLEGKYAVSRGPVIYPNKGVPEYDTLLFLIAVLNSAVCNWYISTHSHKYARGYSMLEVKTLEQLPVPDPSQVPGATRIRLFKLVEHRLADPTATEAEMEIDAIVAGLYGLSGKERQALGLEG